MKKIFNGNISDKTNFLSDDYLHINSCGYQHCETMYTVIRKNGRFDYHILLINSGKCEAIHNEKSYTLGAGNIIIYEPGDKQQYTFYSDTNTLWIHFSGKIIPELFSNSKLKSGIYMLEPNKSVYESYAETIQRHHQPGREKFANASLLELLYNISDSLSPNKTKSKYEDIILPVLNYINKNYNKKISVRSLAEITGYSISRFSKIFLSVTGTTPGKYQNIMRLNMSCELLISTNCYVSDIAYKCGFSDPMYYSRIFKKFYNITPSQFRNKKQM